MSIPLLSPQSSLLEVAQRMEATGASEVALFEGASLAGKITEHDLVVAVLAKGLNPYQLLAEDIMIPACADQSPVEEGFAHQDSA